MSRLGELERTDWGSWSEQSCFEFDRHWRTSRCRAGGIEVNVPQSGARVLLSDDAARDLDEIYAHVNYRESWSEAEQLLARIADTLAELSAKPEGNGYPAELLELGIREYREARTEDLRLIYRSTGSAVHILLIIDGRRDLRSLLQRRLLEA